MKKIVAFLLAAMMLLTLCACNKEADGEQETSTAPKDDKLYMLTKRTEYNADGLALNWTEYKYDDIAQLVVQQQWRLVADGTGAYTEDCESKLVYAARFAYDAHNNCTSVEEMESDTIIATTFTYRYPEGEQDHCFQELDIYSKTSKYGTGIYCAVQWQGQRLGGIESDTGSRGSFGYQHVREALIKEIPGYPTDMGKTWEYFYENEKLLSMTCDTGDAFKPAKTLWEFTYDMDGRLIQMDVTDKNGQKVDSRKYTYDAKGYPATMEDSSGITTFTCDDHGNIIHVTCSDGSYVEYQYQAIEVTEQQRSNYQHRYIMSFGTENTQSVLFARWAWNKTPWYHLISNPVLDFPYPQFFV